MAQISRIGFGQVEPNHLSARRNGKIYAQLPCNSDIKILENGQFAKYSYAEKEVNFTGEGEWLLVLDEVRLYDDAWRESYKDYALKAEGTVGGEMYPRLLKTDIGDIFTTNCIKEANTSGTAKVNGEDLAVKDKLTVNAQGFLEKDEEANETEMVWQVVQVYNMADGQPAVKVQRIQ